MLHLISEIFKNPMLEASGSTDLVSICLKEHFSDVWNARHQFIDVFMPQYTYILLLADLSFNVTY